MAASAKYRQRSALHNSASTSRSMSLDDMYFGLLDGSWGRVVLTFGLLYAMAFVLLALPAAAGPIDGGPSSMAGPAAAFAATVSNVLTMGFGVLQPASPYMYAVFTTQHVVGIVVNVFALSIVINKFQQPKSRLVFSSTLLTYDRDGEPHLFFRIGNRRMNILYHPEVKVSLLEPRRTEEGETFISNTALEVNLPGTLSGSSTFGVRLEPGSKLYELIIEGGESALRDSGIVISVAFIALDAVYHDNVVAVHRYRARDVLRDQRFADIFVGGTMDFSRFDDTVPAATTSAPAITPEDYAAAAADAAASAAGMTAAELAAKLKALDVPLPDDLASHAALARAFVQAAVTHYGVAPGQSLSDAAAPAPAAALEPEPEWVPGVVYLTMGCSRLPFDGAPKARGCIFSRPCAALLAASGAPHVFVDIELSDKPEWFKRIFPAGTCPSMKFNDVVLTGQQEICDWMLSQEHWPAHGFFARPLPRLDGILQSPGALSLADVQKTFIMPFIGSALKGKDVAESGLSAALDWLEAALAATDGEAAAPTFVGGEAVSAYDLVFGAIARGFEAYWRLGCRDAPSPLSHRPALRSWLERMGPYLQGFGVTDPELALAMYWGVLKKFGVSTRPEDVVLRDIVTAAEEAKFRAADPHARIAALEAEVARLLQGPARAAIREPQPRRVPARRPARTAPEAGAPAPMPMPSAELCV